METRMMGSISWCSEQLPLSDDAVERRRREEKGRRGTGLRWYTARDNRNNRTTPCTALVNLDYHGEMEELRGRKWDLTSKMKTVAAERRGRAAESKGGDRRCEADGVSFDSNLTYFSRKIFRSFEVRNSPKWVGLVSTSKAVLFFPFPHLVSRWDKKIVKEKKRKSTEQRRRQ